VLAGDPEQVREVVDNLVGNALKYAGSAGPVEVTVRSDGAQVRLDVRDHGPGIPAGEQSALFERWSRTDASRAALLRHVLDNLVGNALKYVQPGRTPKIDVSASPAGAGWVRIEVADRGIGVPDADKPYVFESFHRAHTGQSYGGTGLGLAICRRVIDRHGGSITVVDNPGGGSRFSFTVPGAPIPAETPAGVTAHEYV
jgi:signal transduction histidine kinase